jgi:hypothetical protein
MLSIGEYKQLQDDHVKVEINIKREELDGYKYPDDR